MTREKTKKTGQTSAPPGPETKKEIEEKAYYRWLSRGGSDGWDLDDWTEAEREVLRNVLDRQP